MRGGSRKCSLQELRQVGRLHGHCGLAARPGRCSGRHRNGPPGIRRAASAPYLWCPARCRHRRPQRVRQDRYAAGDGPGVQIVPTDNAGTFPIWRRTTSRSTTRGAQHGYAIIEALRSGSSGALHVPTGTVYPGPHRLERSRQTSRFQQLSGTELSSQWPLKRQHGQLEPVGHCARFTTRHSVHH